MQLQEVKENGVFLLPASAMVYVTSGVRLCGMTRDLCMLSERKESTLKEILCPTGQVIWQSQDTNTWDPSGDTGIPI